MPIQTYDITGLGNQAASVDLIATGVIALAAILTARALHGRLPRGMPEGMFAAGLSGAACLTVAARSANVDEAATTLVSVLAGLSLAWLLAANVPGGDQRVWKTRRSVLSHAALLCALLAGLVLLRVDTSGLGERMRARTEPLRIWALIAAAAALSAMIGQGLIHWRFRKRASRSDPAQLAEPIGRPVWLFRSVVAVAALAGACALLTPQSALGPFTLSLAALACFNVFHRNGGGATGDIGMIFLVAAVVTAATGWLPVADSSAGLSENALIGLAMGGTYALWLAKFWEQQLLDGEPWTSTGRLIPAARRCGAAAGVGCGAAAAIVSWDQLDSGIVRPVIGAMLTLVLAVALIRNANRTGSRTSEFCAWPAVAGAMVVLSGGAGLVADIPALWLPFLAIGGLFVAFFRRGRTEFEDNASLADGCWLGGILPVIILYGALTCGPRTPQNWVWAASASLPAAASFIHGRERV